MINFKKIISFSLVFLMLFQAASFLNIGMFKSNQAYATNAPAKFEFFNGNIPNGAVGDWNMENNYYWLNNAQGQHQMYFEDATNKMYVNQGGILYAVIKIDPNNLPSEVMFQWHSSDGWEHRAYWGSNCINWGTDGQVSRKNMSSQIPQTGQFITLEIPAASVGLENSYVDGFALTLFNGRCAINSAGAFDHSEYIKIINKSSGKALDSYGNNNGDDVRQWDYWGGDNQLWKIIYVDTGIVKIVNKKSGKLLNSCGNNNGDDVRQSNDLDDNQKWDITPATGGYVKIINHETGKALDSYGNNNGDDVRQWDYYGGDNQLWSLGDSTSFSVIESSDPQYGFWNANNWDLENSHMDSMKQLRLSIGDFLKGTIINGDLTAFGDQNGNLGRFNDKASALGMTVWPGLGNHDYQNNINDSYNNYAAAGMMTYMENTIWGYGYSFDWYRDGLRSYHKGSLSYSWDVNGVHFVQLNNYATYETYFEQNSGAIKYDIKNSLDWLRNDLQNAGNKPIIINLHQIVEGSNPQVEEGFNQLKNLLKDFPHVSAIFCGHLHDNISYDCSTGNTYGNIPIFYCGSAGSRKYLNVRFNVGLKKMYVDRITSTSTSIEGSEEFNLR